MPHRVRAALLLAALAAAPVPAPAQSPGSGGGSAAPGAAPGAGTGPLGSQGTVDPTARLLRPETLRPAPFPEPYRPPPAAPWAAQPAPGAKPPSGGILTERQARDRIAAAGYANLRSLRPTYSGSWTGQATMRGTPLRVTVDARGNVTTEYSEGYR